MQEDLTCSRATKPVGHNYWACAVEPGSHNYSALRSQLLKPSCPRACAPQQAAAAKSLQSCPTLCDPIDGSPSGSPVPGILQARTLEWVAISFSNAWKWKVKVKSLSRVWLLVTPWTAAYQAPLSMGFSRQEYWSGVPLLSPATTRETTIMRSLCTAARQKPPLATTRERLT